MENLQECQAPIDLAIVNALIAATPESWCLARMEVRRREEGSQESMLIEISSPEGHRDVVQATNEIYESLYRLSDCFRRFGRVWSGVSYRVSLDEAGDWNYQADFEY